MILSHKTTIKEKLKANGYRMSGLKIHVFEILLKSARPLDIQEIIAQTPNMHFVSVYRCIMTMQKAGIITKVLQKNKTKYELTDVFRPHHHHATCINCGSSVDIENRELEELLYSIYQRIHFSPSSHQLELQGFCKKCVL